MEIEGEYQIRKFLSAKGWPIQKNDGTVSCEMELLPSACFIVVPEKEGETAVSFTFYGGGYGHGVGLSQWGAKALAEQGQGYADILAHYFPGTQLCR
jgi:stage II sporulation protein D